MKNICCSIIFSLLLTFHAVALDFRSKTMAAGKASLTENAFFVSQLLDSVNFSPELRFPIQLIYHSASEKSGLFGYAWNSPQLESSAFYDKDGVLWTTPWGEKIKFFPKNETLPKDAIKIELYEQAKKGRGFYAPYSEWEANTPQRDYEKSDKWVFYGKGDKKGWKFTYREFRLQSITAPSGRSIEFIYSNGMLASIMQNGGTFVEITYQGNIVSSMKINGIPYRFSYAKTKLKILPKTDGGKIISASKLCLASFGRGALTPMKFEYDDYGFLTLLQHGDFVDKLVIQHQTIEERHAELKAQADKKIKFDGPINGRILSDNDFQYKYFSAQPGVLELTNRLQQNASYSFNSQTGIFHIREFSGLKYIIYYFMRYDVAYLGKVRKIVDGRNRDVINYRYDKLTGNVFRIRDIAGNDTNFEYNGDAQLVRITRRASDQETPEPIRAFGYDQQNNPNEISILDATGKAVVTIKMHYNSQRQVVQISDGRQKHRFRYNDFGYPIAITNAFGQTAAAELDSFNRMTSFTDFYGVKTYYTYTPEGLPAKIERKDGGILLNSLTIAYNDLGQPISYTDQTGKTKTFERDAFGRVVKELFPDDTEVSYTYNELGQLHTVLDQNRHVIKFDWNRFGLDARTTPVGQLTDYVHDKFGLLTRLDSKAENEKARSVKFEYDSLDRLIKLDYGNGDIEERTYDSWGKLLTSKRGHDEVTYQYDYWGRMTKRQSRDEVMFIVYNPYGQRIERTIERNGVKMNEKRIYDSYGRLVRIVAGDKTVEYVYNSRNQIHRQIVNGTIIEFTYNKYGQLQGKKMMEKGPDKTNTKEKD